MDGFVGGGGRYGAERRQGNERRRTTLSSNNTTLTQGIPEELEIRFLEQTLRGTFRVRRVGDDHVELVLAVLQKLEAIADMHFHVRVLEPDAHSGEVLLGYPHDGLVNVAQDGFLDGFVLHDFPENPAVAAADDEDFLRVRVRVHGEVGDHFLVAVAGQRGGVCLTVVGWVGWRAYENSSRSVH